MFKSILTKHSEDTNCSSLINDLQFALKVNKNIEYTKRRNFTSVAVTYRTMTLD